MENALEIHTSIGFCIATFGKGYQPMGTWGIKRNPTILGDPIEINSLSIYFPLLLCGSTLPIFPMFNLKARILNRSNL